MNAQATITMTDYGRRVLETYYLSLGLNPKAYIKADLSGRLTEELWSIMHIFGPTMFMGNNEMTFENNEIEIEAEVIKRAGEIKL